MSRTGTLGRLFAPRRRARRSRCTRRSWRVAAGATATWCACSSRRGAIVLPLRSQRRRGAGAGLHRHALGRGIPVGRAAAGAPLAGVNALMPGDSARSRKQPELKHAAVKVRTAGPALAPGGRGLAARADAAAAVRGACARCSARLRLRHCVPFGREPDAAAWSACCCAPPHRQPVSDAVLADIEDALGDLAGSQVLRYVDARKGQRRAMLLDATDTAEAGGATLEAFLLAGDASAAGWVLDLLQATACRRGRSAGAAERPRHAAAPPCRRAAPQVCNCFDVSQDAIAAALASCTRQRRRTPGAAAAPPAMRHRMRLLPAGAAPAGGARRHAAVLAAAAGAAPASTTPAAANLA